MIYMHENNIDGKISSNYNGLKDKLMDFKKNVYIPFKSSSFSSFAELYSKIIAAQAPIFATV